MEEERKDMTPSEEQGYVPRPRWQVWLARLGLVVFIIFLILFYVNIYRGGR